jgi:hypothetical protein
MTFPSFVSGEVLRAEDMNAVGLWLVKSQAVGSGVSTVTVTGAFSADFDTYLITYGGGTQSTSTDVYFQIGGSSTGYYGTLIYNSVASSTPVGAVNNNNNRADWIGGGTAGQASHANFVLINPFQAAYTKIRMGNYQNDLAFGTYNGTHAVATSYTSFLIGVAAGSLTGGTISVYGYKK